MADRKTLAARFKADETVVTAWSVLPAPVVAEAMARAGSASAASMSARMSAAPASAGSMPS